MVQLQYSGSKRKVSRAVEKANEILAAPAFYEQIAQADPFDFTSFSPGEIADILKSAGQTIIIKSKLLMPIANASTQSSQLIEVSSLRFSKHLPTAVNTLIHETVHAIDFIDHSLEFTHDGNESVNQENTAPWRIGKIAENMVEAQFQFSKSATPLSK